jgi:DNA-binding response OmpR family regulator
VNVKVLVVEDDPKIAAALRRGLSAEGFEVVTASDGDDGFWRAMEGQFDVIVLDIMLPARNGYVVCRDLRDAGNWTPILMLTAKSGELDEAEGLDTGADDYLTKPFSFPVLVSRIRALARRVAHRDMVPSEIDGLRMDTNARKVWVHGTEVELTGREYDVLEFLVRRAGQAVTKDAILDGVWDAAAEADPNLVEVYVGRVRRKLADGFGWQHLTTVRGVGYRIDGAAR